jgi:hypothetical protein
MSAGDADAITETSPEDTPSHFSEELSTTMEVSDSSIPDAPLSLSNSHLEQEQEQDAVSIRSVSTPPLKTPSVLDSAAPSLVPPSYGLPTTFVRQKNGWTPKGQRRLMNSLLAGVGLLELGNAGDFAANVWNQIPVPHFAMGLSKCS